MTGKREAILIWQNAIRDGFIRNKPIEFFRRQTDNEDIESNKFYLDTLSGGQVFLFPIICFEELFLRFKNGEFSSQKQYLIYKNNEFSSHKYIFRSKRNTQRDHKITC